MTSPILYSSFMLQRLPVEELDAPGIPMQCKKNSMDRHKGLAEGLLTGWAVDACQANAQCKRLHAFDPVHFVPTGNTPYDRSADSAGRAGTKESPVSLVTGEALLRLVDGELDGLLAFTWSRLYRSSAAEIDHGLGFGWSHGLAQRLLIEGEELLWIDHENRSTRFPMPSERRPAVTKRLWRAAIYLGDAPAELILAQAGKTPRFYHFQRDAQGGQLIAISDAYGNRISLDRDLAGRIQRLDNNVGRALKLRYEGLHIVAVDYQIQHPAEHEDDSWQTVQTLARYRYNVASQLLEVSNALGESERYRYDEANVILDRQLAGGATFYWEWQGTGRQARCVHHWASFEQTDVRYHWGDNGGVTVTDADGNEERYLHDEHARLIKQVAPDGAQTLKSYDDKGQLITEQDALGAITEYRYDEAGHLSAVIPPQEQPITYEYRNGFISTARRGEASWQYRRNAQGDITEQIDPHGHATRYSYDSQGRLLAINHPDDSTHRLSWNPLGQLLKEQLPNGGERRYRHDAMGRQISRQDESGAITHYQWDALGHLTQVALPSGGIRAFNYNAYGKVTSERDELGRVTRYEYADGLPLVSRRITAANCATATTTRTCCSAKSRTSAASTTA